MKRKTWSSGRLWSVRERSFAELEILGPESPDSLFGRAAQGGFDWVLALYHDQGLIAVKTHAWGMATNWTLGLPIIRTSVDHGTAFDIAGHGQARVSPLRHVVETTLGLIDGRAAPRGFRGAAGEGLTPERRRAMAMTPSTMLPLGTEAPRFELPEVDGPTVSLDDFRLAPGLLVMFLCNHCPFVKHIRSELAAFARDYQEEGLAVVAISSNDVEAHPEDSPEMMSRRRRRPATLSPISSTRHRRWPRPTARPAPRTSFSSTATCGWSTGGSSTQPTGERRAGHRCRSPSRRESPPRRRRRHSRPATQHRMQYQVETRQQP